MPQRPPVSSDRYAHPQQGTRNMYSSQRSKVALPTGFSVEGRETGLQLWWDPAEFQPTATSLPAYSIACIVRRSGITYKRVILQNDAKPGRSARSTARGLPFFLSRKPFVWGGPEAITAASPHGQQRFPCRCKVEKYMPAEQVRAPGGLPLGNCLSASALLRAAWTTHRATRCAWLHFAVCNPAQPD